MTAGIDSSVISPASLLGPTCQPGEHLVGVIHPDTVAQIYHQSAAYAWLGCPDVLRSGQAAIDTAAWVKPMDLAAENVDPNQVLGHRIPGWSFAKFGNDALSDLELAIQAPSPSVRLLVCTELLVEGPARLGQISDQGLVGVSAELT